MPSTIQNMLENSAWIGLMYLLVTSLRKKKTIKIFEISQAHLLQVVSVLEGSVLTFGGWQASGCDLGLVRVWIVDNLYEKSLCLPLWFIKGLPGFSEPLYYINEISQPCCPVI